MSVWILLYIIIGLLSALFLKNEKRGYKDMFFICLGWPLVWIPALILISADYLRGDL